MFCDLRSLDEMHPEVADFELWRIRSFVTMNNAPQNKNNCSRKV